MINLTEIIKARKAMNLDQLVDTLKTALSKAHDKATVDFLVKHLTGLEQKNNDGTATQKDVDFILNDVKKSFGENLATLADRPFMEGYINAYGMAKRAIRTDFALKDKDMGAINTMNEYSCWWVRENMSDEAIRVLKKELSQTLEDGSTRKDLSRRMSESMKGLVNESRVYWEILADHMLTKVESMGHVSGYEEAGVEYVRIVAVLDTRTTPICQHMHGRIIEVKRLRQQYNDIVSAAKSKDKKKVMAAQPMIKASNFSNVRNTFSTEKLTEKHGLAMPPYHFRCRTTEVAFFVEEVNIKSVYGDKADKKALSGYTDMELSAWLEEVKERSSKLKYDPDDWKDDKKHLGEIEAKDMDELLSMCRDTVKNSKGAVLKHYQNMGGDKEIQYQFHDEKRIVTLDQRQIFRNVIKYNPKTWEMWNKKRGRELK